MRRVRLFLTSRPGFAVIAIALGVANTVALIGWAPLDPTSTTWIFGDNATYFFGWEMFRHDPYWTLPLTWTDRVGYPVGTSIALLDAIPIAAIVLRPLSALLPQPFQYLGLFAAVCFVLQAYFGLSLCRRLAPDQPAFIVLGGVFFLISAPLTWRALGHTTLLSQWLILAGLDSYFRDPDASAVRWLARFWIWIAIAAATTPYIAAMCFLVTLAGIARLLIERRCGWLVAGGLVAASAAVMFTGFLVTGVIVASDAAAYRAAGYGFLSMNLNAPVNPMQYGSIVLPPLPLSSPAQVEGYNYFGLGMIGLLVLNVARRPRSVLWLTERRLLPLVGLGAACTALAVSSTVTLNSSTLVASDLPHWAASIAQGVRASGRLFWPAYYLVVAGALSMTFWLWRPPLRIVVLVPAVAVQLVDLGPLRARVRRTADERFAELTLPPWRGLGRDYDNLILVPPFQCGPEIGPGGYYGFVTFSKLAVAERMRSNSYYAARYTRRELYAHCVEILGAQLEGKLDARSAYVVTDGVKTLWDLRGLRSHRCQAANGYNLCTPAAPGTAADPPSDAPAYEIGQRLDFTSDLRGSDVMPVGWGEPEEDGIWTQGPLALVRLRLPSPMPPGRPLMLTVDGRPFLDPQRPRLFVDVAVNGQIIDRWTLGPARTRARREARIPPELIAGRRTFDIEFHVRNPEVPLYVDASPSISFRGMHVRWLALDAK